MRIPKRALAEFVHHHKQAWSETPLFDGELRGSSWGEARDRHDLFPVPREHRVVHNSARMQISISPLRPAASLAARVAAAEPEDLLEL
jgi:hypothetical protein